MKRCIKYLLILPFIPLLFTGNANAVSLTVDVEPTGNRWTVGTDVRCTLGDGTTINANQYGECNFDAAAGVLAGGQSVRNIYKSTNIPIIEGNYYSTIVGYANGDLNTYDIIWNMNVDTSNFIISSWRQVTKDELEDSGYCSRYRPNNSDYICDSANSYVWRSTYYEVVLKAVRTADVQFMLGNPTNKSLFIVVGGQLSISAIDEYTASGATQITQEIHQQTITQHEDSEAVENAVENVQNSVDAVNDTLTETNEFLTDDSPADVDSSSLANTAGWLPPGPVDSVLTTPVALAQGIVNVFTQQGTCTPLHLPLPWVDYTLDIPCIGPLITQAGFDGIWNIVGGVISAFIIYDTLKWLYRFVDDTLSFRENNSGLWGGL